MYKPFSNIDLTTAVFYQLGIGDTTNWTESCRKCFLESTVLTMKTDFLAGKKIPETLTFLDKITDV